MTYDIDIGGSKIEVAVFDENLTLMDCWRICTSLDDYWSFMNTIPAKENDDA